MFRDLKARSQIRNKSDFAKKNRASYIRKQNYKNNRHLKKANYVDHIANMQNEIISLGGMQQIIIGN